MHWFEILQIHKLDACHLNQIKCVNLFGKYFKDFGVIHIEYMGSSLNISRTFD